MYSYVFGILGAFNFPTWFTPILVNKLRRSLQRDVARSSPVEAPTIWIDISVITQRDAGTGIQRVVRALANELAKSTVSGFTVKFVAATRNDNYRQVLWDGGKKRRLEASMSPKCGDIFLGLDLAAHIVPRHLKELLAWKRSGLRFVFVVYDLIPLEHSKWFSNKLVRAFRNWVGAIMVLSDKVVCISEAESRFFDKYKTKLLGRNEWQIKTSIIPLGSDISASSPTAGLSNEFYKVKKAVSERVSVLMVGTIEPRKGYWFVLDAFEFLWARNMQINLVIVGRPGWKTEALQKRISSHRQNKRLLFWLNDASDEALSALYESCNGLIFASYAEGFGLPIVEALSYCKPILIRDIDVFKQFDSPLVSFFDKDISAQDFSENIESWLRKVEISSSKNEAASTNNIVSWSESALVLIKELVF